MEAANLQEAQNLLSIASKVLHYEEALIKATGENFNIFNILRIAHYEVKTHSPMLSELLKPKGMHGQGAVFLSHFCTQLEIYDFDARSAQVRTEYHIGPKTAEDGGRIDIIITDSNDNQIIIENKIYAGEGDNQLERYRNYSDRAQILFLTLDGEKSKDAERLKLLRVRNISYADDILVWLQQCRKEAANAPTVRETITQYIHLIQQLTQQNTNTRMSKELTNAVLNNEPSYLAYTALWKAKRQIEETILESLKNKLEKASGELRLQLCFPDTDMTERYAGFDFRSSAMDAQLVRISFQFQGTDRRGCIFGFSLLAADSMCPSEVKLFDAFKNSFQEAKKSKRWVAYTAFDLYPQWNETTMAEIQFRTFSVELMKIVMKLLGVFKEAIPVI